MKRRDYDTMGVDQYGQCYHALGKYPRKELLKRLSRTKAAVMYEDDADGNAVQKGWIIAGLWIDIYKVTPYFDRKGKSK